MKSLQNLFGRLSTIRIIVWAAITSSVLGILGGYFGEPPPVAKSNFTMGMAPGDPRVVQRHYPRIDNAFTVAWVTDSSPTILRSKGGHPDNIDRVGFVQDRILERTPDINGHPLSFAMYMQVFGPKAIDKYFEAQHAIRLKPDLLIYGVNPTFDFTPWDMMGEPRSPGALSAFGGANSVKWTLLLATPAQILEANIATLLPAVERRFALGKQIDALRAQLDPFNLRSTLRPPSPTGWSMMRWRAARTGLTPTPSPERPSSELVQITAMRLMDLGARSWGKVILQDLVADLRRSGTPALIYMIPVSLQAIESDPIAAANFHRLESWFAEFATQNSNSNVTIIPQTPSRFIKDLAFYDVSHLTDPAPFVDFLTREIKVNAKFQN